MKANELRTGNYLDYRLKDNKIVVSWEDLREFDRKEQYVLDSIYLPIPLTEEWLIKFGFGKSEFDNEMIDNVSLKDIVINCNYERGGVELEGETESQYLNHIKHVHQLQNLYFALTNEELTIK